MWLVGGEPELVAYLTELDVIVDARVAASEQPFDFQRPRSVKRKWYEIMPGDPDCHIRADGTIARKSVASVTENDASPQGSAGANT